MLSLHCDTQQKTYTLKSESGAWSQSFATSSAAMQHASTVVEGETKLTVYDEDMKVLLVTIVYPA